MKHRTQERPVNRQGLTLVELMIALVLITGILTAIHSVIYTYWTVRNTGIAHVEAARVAFAIREDFTCDMRGLPVRSPTIETTAAANSNPSAFSSLLSFHETHDFTERFIDVDRAKFIEAVDFFLRSNIVSFASQHVNHRFAMADQPELSAESLQTVWWWNNGRDSTTVPVGMANGTLQFATLKGTDWPEGLIRIQIPIRRIPRRVGRNSLDPDMMTSNGGRVDAIESIRHGISEVTFRCLDRRDWMDSWDSTKSERLPKAIELNMAIEGDVLRIFVQTGELN